MWRVSRILCNVLFVTSAHAAVFLQQVDGKVAAEIVMQTRQAERTPSSTLGQGHVMFMPKDDNETRVHDNETSVPSEKTSVPSEMTASCMKHTGGTCLVSKCADWRGAGCELGRCFCPEHRCAGADGSCYKETYKTLIQQLKIRNVRWPDMYMYAARTHHTVYVGQTTDSTSEFTLRQFPDKEDVLLTSVEWPDHVVHVVEQDSCQDYSLVDLHHQQRTSTNHSGVPNYKVDCSEKGCVIRQEQQQQQQHQLQQQQSADGCFSYEPQSRALEGMLSGSHLSAPTAALRLEASPEGDYVMINSDEFFGHYFYVSHGKWTVNTYKGDPGTGGYWTFDPPLPESFKLPKYDGPRCSDDCG